MKAWLGPIGIVTDRRVAASLGRDFGELVQAALRGLGPGEALVQLREKDLSARELLLHAKRLLQMTRDHRCPLLVNDRLDVALAAGADGVHLPEQGLDIATVRRLARQNDFLVGVSTHSPDGAGAAARDGADLVFLGPIFETPSKRRYGAPLGLEALSAAARAVREARPAVKLYAIGGVDSPELAAEVRRRGAHGIAAVRAFMTGDDPAAKAAELAQVLRP